MTVTPRMHIMDDIIVFSPPQIPAGAAWWAFGPNLTDQGRRAPNDTREYREFKQKIFVQLLHSGDPQGPS